MWIGLGLEWLGSFEEKKANNGVKSLLYTGPMYGIIVANFNFQFAILCSIL